MKRSRLFFSLLLIVGILGVNVAHAQSVSSKVNVWYNDYIPSLDEIVSGPIILHVVVHLNKDGVSTKHHVQPQLTSLTGETTGMVYIGTGVRQTMFDSKPAGNGANTFSYINIFQLVGKGIKYSVKTTSHITINSKGEITVLFEK